MIITTNKNPFQRNDVLNENDTKKTYPPYNHPIERVSLICKLMVRKYLYKGGNLKENEINILV